MRPRVGAYGLGARVGARVGGAGIAVRVGGRGRCPSMCWPRWGEILPMYTGSQFGHKKT